MTASHSRRWFHFAFSLRTLFVVLTLLGCWLGWNANVVHQRKRLLAMSREHGLKVAAPARGVLLKMNVLIYVGAKYDNQFENLTEVSYVRQLLGDEAVAVFNFLEPPPAELGADLRKWFPESVFDYRATPENTYNLGSYLEEAARDPERFSLPTQPRLAEPNSSTFGR